MSERETSHSMDDIEKLPVFEDDVIPQEQNSCIAKYAPDIAAKFYSNLTMTRAQSQCVINAFDIFLNSSIINSLKYLVLDSVPENLKEKIGDRFEEVQSAFVPLNSEHKCMKALTNNRCFIPPQKITFTYVEEQNRAGTLENKKITASFVPLQLILKHFFEIPGVFDETCEYISMLKNQNDGYCSNILQTEFWKKKTRGIDDLVIPLFLYEDDFETGNPLGSHATVYSMAGLYIAVACLPPRLRSKLNTIFLVQISHAIDVKCSDKKRVYKEIIKNLNSLAYEGIEISSRGKQIRIYFKVALFLGDNLGLNATLGFIKCFSCDYWCRFCTITFSKTKRSYSEDKRLLRTIELYEQDVNKAHKPSNGVKEECVWTQLEGSHPIENYSVDLMHDVLEGTLCYGLGEVFYHLISVSKLFSLEMFNFRIKYFDFREESNRPPLITESRLRFRCLKMSASEVKSITLNLGLLIGEKIPKNNEHWKFYKIMRELLCICLQSKISQSCIKHLEKLVELHNKLYVKLYGDLEPKHHLLVHYPRIMAIIGPVVHTWSMRFEGKHRVMKRGSLLSSNRINLPYTIAFKHQLHQAQIFLNSTEFSDDIQYQNLDRNGGNDMLNSLCKNPDQFLRIKNVSVFGNKYQAGTMIIVSKGELPTYGKIEHIYRKKSETITTKISDISVILSKIRTIKKNDHFQAFQIQHTTSYEFMVFESLAHLEPRKIHLLADNQNYLYYDSYLDL